MGAPSGPAWKIECKIGDAGFDVGMWMQRFEWKSMLNGGYIIRAKVYDPQFQILDSVIEGGKKLLATGRQPDKLTLVEFKLIWATQPTMETKTRVALISDLHARGDDTFNGVFEFIAIDPISYFINSGDASGAAYTGKIGGKGGVIDKVLKDYVPPQIGGYSTDFVVDETDDKESTYWMMRQDPKTFIASLLDWSCPFTKHKTAWVVANGQDDDKKVSIEIKEAWTSKLDYPRPISGDDGPFVLFYSGGGTRDILKWEVLTDSFISALNIKILTSGLSAVSGEYFDKITDKDKEQYVYIKDENTSNKTNPKTTEKQSFTKPKSENGTVAGSGIPRPPSKRGWTHIIAVPEVGSASDIGHKYSRYIDGRARQKYMEMLNMLFRIRVTARGQPRLFDSTELGRAKATLRWQGTDEKSGGGKVRFLDGDWLVYGWHHILVRDASWTTDVYMARLDFDSASIPGSGG